MRRTLLASAVVVLTVVTGPPLASAAPAAPVERSAVATGSGPLAPGDWGQYRNGAPSGFNQAETTL